jgi:cation:H+ antiporter
MTLLESVGLVAWGVVVLAVGGEILVRGAVSLARVLGVTPAVIGLTVVAIGTSFPELVISITAALQGSPDISVGNVVGTNIFNLLGVLGAGALLSSMAVEGSAVRREWPVLLVVTIGFVVVSLDGTLSRLEGLLFVCAYIAFLVYSVRVARREVGGAEEAAYKEEIASRILSRSTMTAIMLIAGGLALLLYGGDVIVDGAVSIARIAGMSERVIALTVIAVGTSMPELASTAVAVRRSRSEVAVANMLGTNVFNILGVLGIGAMLSPTPIAREVIRFDGPWLVGAVLILLPAMRTGFRISRREGVLFLLLYSTYVLLLLRYGPAG